MTFTDAPHPVRRTVGPGTVRVDVRVLRSTIPRIVLQVGAHVDAVLLSDAWGIDSPIAISTDVHQSQWRLAIAGPPLPDPFGPRIAASDVQAGRWRLGVALSHRPSGPLPDVRAGASPAYDLRAVPSGITVTDVVIEPWPFVVTVTEAGRDACSVTVRGDGASIGATLHLRGPAAVDVDVEGIAVEALTTGSTGTDALGPALLDAVEAVALDRGARRVRLPGAPDDLAEMLACDRYGYVPTARHDGVERVIAPEHATPRRWPFNRRRSG